MNVIDTVKQFFKADRATVISDTPTLDAWSAYKGDFPKPLIATKTDPRNDDSLILPIVQEIVNASTAHLLGDGVKIDIKGDGQETAQGFLNDFLNRSKYQTTLRKTALHGSVVGHLFVKLIIKDGKPDRFQVIGSDMVSVETSARDCEEATSYTVRWTAHNPLTNRDDKFMEVTSRNDTGGWTIKEFVSRGGGNRYEQIEETDWPFSFSPIFDCQNLTNALGYWGSPDASAAIIAQNRSVNTTLSLLSRLLRVHSNPKTATVGLNSRKVEWMTDGFIALPEGASVTQLEMSADGAAALLDLYKALREEIHTLSRTPAIASGKLDNVGPISGAALQILYKPLDSKTGEKRAHLGEMMENLCERVLELGGFPGCEVECIFPDTTPKNALEQRQTAQIDSQLGIVSRETLAKELGYSWEIEQEQMAADLVA